MVGLIDIHKAQSISDLQHLNVSPVSKFADPVWDFYDKESIVPRHNLRVFWNEYNLPEQLVLEIKLVAFLLMYEKGNKPLSVIVKLKEIKLFLTSIYESNVTTVDSNKYHNVNSLSDLTLHDICEGFKVYKRPRVAYVFSFLTFVSISGFYGHFSKNSPIQWNKLQIESIRFRHSKSTRQFTGPLEDNLVCFLISNSTYLVNLFMFKLYGDDKYLIEYKENKRHYTSPLEEVDEFPIIFERYKEIRTGTGNMCPKYLRADLKNKFPLGAQELHDELYLIQTACQFLFLQFTGMRYGEAVKIKFTNLIEGPYGIYLINGKVQKHRKSNHIVNTDYWATIPIVKLAFDAAMIISELGGQDRILSNFNFTQRANGFMSPSTLNNRLCFFLYDVDVQRLFSNECKPGEFGARNKSIYPEHNLTSLRLRHTVGNQLVLNGLNLPFLSQHFKHLSISLYTLYSFADVTLSYGNISQEIINDPRLYSQAIKSIEDRIKQRDNVQGPGAKSFIDLRNSLQEGDRLDFVVEVGPSYCIGRNKVADESGRLEEPPCIKIGQCQSWRCKNAFTTIDKLARWEKLYEDTLSKLSDKKYNYLTDALLITKRACENIIKALKNGAS
jgi:integrase